MPVVNASGSPSMASQLVCNCPKFLSLIQTPDSLILHHPHLFWTDGITANSGYCEQELRTYYDQTLKQIIRC